MYLFIAEAVFFTKYHKITIKPNFLNNISYRVQTPNKLRMLISFIHSINV